MRFGIVTTLAAGVVSSLVIAVPARADETQRWYYLNSLGSGKAIFRAYNKAELVQRSIDNVRLRDGVNAADVPIYSDLDTFVDGELTAGRMCLVNLAKATSEQIELQSRAGRCTKKPLPVEERNAKNQPSYFDQTWSWLNAHWQKLVGGVTFAGLLFVARWLYKMIRAATARKAVDLILAGVPAAGKTSLYRRLLDPDISPSKIDEIEMSTTVDAKRIDSIDSGKFVFFPRLKDIPGTYLGKIIDEFAQRKRFLGFSITKIALVVVLAPIGLQRGELAAADRDYLNSQLGWSTLIQAITQSQRLHKPDVIAIFVNKSDLYEGVVSLEKLGDRIAIDFRAIVVAIEKAAADAKIPVVFAFGSARLGIGTHDFLSKLTRKIINTGTE